VQFLSEHGSGIGMNVVAHYFAARRGEVPGLNYFPLGALPVSQIPGNSFF
jgi:hypothetical protein